MNGKSYESKTVEAAGFHTEYLEAGEPGNPTVVLVHDGAFGATAELCWAPVIERLSGEFHVLAPDLLGWGGTDKVVYLDRSPYAARVPHVAAWCRAVGVRHAVFVGASFGGSLVLRALADPSAPWPMARAVSVSGTGGPYRLPAGIEALGSYEPSLAEAQRLTGLLVTGLDGLAEHVEQRYRNSLVPGHWEAMKAPVLKNPAVERALPSDPFFDQLAQVTAPVLLVEGRNDQLLEKQWAKKLADVCPAVEVAETDYGHEPNIEAPDALVDLILPFLRGE